MDRQNDNRKDTNKPNQTGKQINKALIGHGKSENQDVEVQFPRNMKDCKGFRTSFVTTNFYCCPLGCEKVQEKEEKKTLKHVIWRITVHDFNLI